ncbi:small integral membrane protein 3 [Protopterus annectens]|uniref:small integral membrane protein 3 n=1 Tax=Protopterus annectens TaxID=7888 RepID=UPI001CFBA547|nr:small integral membrane protein 3 [Protopterus annectens]XP_043925335.1 small integral membrane protein 3 [Protopterus annectens]XP_043925336.1 small integral membrane protein 3 [Protopterus annectens]
MMDSTTSDNLSYPKHILDIWAIILVIIATVIVMTALLLCPAAAVIAYRVRTNPARNGIV